MLAFEQDTTFRSQTPFLGIAAALHVALLLWNPVLLRFHAWLGTPPKNPTEIIMIDPVIPEVVAKPVASRPAPMPPQRAPRAIPATTPPPAAPHPPLRRSHPFSGLPTLPLDRHDSVAVEVGVPRIAPIAPTPALDAGPRAPTLQDQRVRTPISGAPALHNRELGLVHALPSAPAEMPAAVVPAASSTPTPLVPEGEVANRGILRRVIPQYPAWAEEQAISGTVRLFFVVTREGKVRSTIRVEQTSGHAGLDQLAVDALRQWRFTPAEADGEWGRITFVFKVS